MGFQFNFTFTDSETVTANPQSEISSTQTPSAPSTRIDTSNLPTTYEVIAEPVEIGNEETGQKIILLKRNVTDIIFDFVQNDTLTTSTTDGEPEKNSIVNAINSKSDLIPGVYEGGMKTWECTYDLICYLSSFLISFPDKFEHKKVLEIGCGSGMPGVFCLVHANLERMDFQDYNTEVLSAVTIPNVLLNTRKGETESPSTHVEIVLQSDVLPSNTNYYAGDWSTFGEINETKYDLMISSETIYNIEAYPKLVKVLGNNLAEKGIALFACKSLYFGCTGNSFVFSEHLRKSGFFVESVAAFGENTLKREILLVRHE